MRLLLLNGPNLNLLGTREPRVYGHHTLADVERLAQDTAVALGAEVRCVQSNHEGALIDAIHAAAADCAGMIINPAGYGHTSVALRDAVAAVDLPTVEVHLTNVAKREAFRHTSYLSGVAVGTITGLGAHGYALAVRALVHVITQREEAERS